MFETRYALRHMVRSRGRSLAIFLSVLALMLLQIGLWETAEAKKTELALLYSDYPVECRISSTSKVRTETLRMNEHYLTVCTAPDGALTPYIKDVVYKHSVVYEPVPAMEQLGYTTGEYIADADMYGNTPRAEVQAQSYFFGANLPNNLIVGLTGFAATSKLAPSEISGVTFLDGYGEADFTGSEPICMLHREYMEAMGLALGDTLTLTAIESAVLSNDRPFAPWEMSMKIIGAIEGAGGPEVYCPFALISDAVHAQGQMVTLESLAFTLKDNRLMNDMKLAAAQYFSVVEQVREYNSDKYSLTVFDGAYYTALKTLRRDMRLFDLLTPVCFLVSFFTAFLVSFLTTRTRRQEALLLRSIGMQRGGIFYTLFIEQVLLCLAGVAVGWGASRLFGGGIRPVYPLVFLACCLMGCCISCAATLRANILTSIKGRE